MHGKGVRNWTNGAKYEGEFQKGLACGWGKFSFPNGDSFEGQF